MSQQEAEAPAAHSSSEASLPSHADASHWQLRLILAALQDGVILIEPDQTISWANQAALKMHGVQEIAGLGHTVSDYRARFELRDRSQRRLPAGTYPMERVLSGEAFDEVVVDVYPAGTDEALWTHRIRSLVLTDSHGLPDCLVLIVNDETDRFEAEERFEATFAANPAPAAILRLADHRFVKVNQGFLEMSGYEEQEVLGRSAYEVDVLEDAARRELAIERLQQGCTIPQMEATLQLPRGGEKRVIVAGQPIEIGDEQCMLFTFVDIEALRQAEEARHQNHQAFHLLLGLIPVPALVSSVSEERLLQVNSAFERATGITGQASMAWDDARFWGDAMAAAELRERLDQHGEVHGHEVRLRSADGSLIPFRATACQVTWEGKDCVIMILEDVAEERRSEAEIAAALSAVMEDTSWLAAAVQAKLAQLRRPDLADNAVATEPEELSPRGREVLGLICRGADDGEIADRLGIARNTVRNHISALFRKAGVGSRAGLVIWARERRFDGGPRDGLPLGELHAGRRPGGTIRKPDGKPFA
ncbi:PAS domain S-box protein [Teichococcus vastitatis]|uniref:PAS domain S-box protein n=1 Tax=Teichococcus vastitatis TaxID=2307076 RepID=A0ABS9W8D1_9PROT|nr:PAS domain S-box protein [Pseudoroseomonas vastitatis]MCI0755551.1 PAS domain S-box protein [Pseudoroseomonas vastitatis]